MSSIDIREEYLELLASNATVNGRLPSLAASKNKYALMCKEMIETVDASKGAFMAELFRLTSQ